MRKRAGLARALVLEPRILLVDEPSSGLDRITASEIDELLLREKVERRTTLIVVTHDVRGARRIADRIAVLESGTADCRWHRRGSPTQRERDRSQFDIGVKRWASRKKASASSLSEGSCCLGSGCFSSAIAISCSRATPRTYTEFTNLSGLTTGAKVRVSGLDAGEVLTIDVPDSPAARFRLRFRIDAQLRALVRSDSVVTIGREGVVGGTYLSVRPGSSQAPQADALATIPSAEPTELSALLTSSCGTSRRCEGRIERCHGGGIERE